MKVSKTKSILAQKVNRAKKTLPGTKQTSLFFEIGICKGYVTTKKPKTLSKNANNILTGTRSNMSVLTTKETLMSKPCGDKTDK